jgi:hypothetical protein
MATFINLHQRKEPLFVNLDLVSHIKAATTAAGEHSQIYFADGGSIYVDESMIDIVQERTK